MIGTPTQRRISLSFFDQAVSSGSNFATGVVVARLSGPAAFGEYMLAFTIWVVVVGLHRALITDPLIVSTGDAEATPTTISDGANAEILLGVGVCVVVGGGALASVAAGAPFGRAILALSPWLVVLLLQDYWRAIAFQRRRPGLALVNDCLFAVVQALATVAFVLLGWRTPGYIISAWGIGATAGALLGMLWFRPVRHLRQGWSLMRRVWPLSRWTLADFGTGFASDQAYLAFVALLLSPANYGGFRAASSFMGPTIVILHAGSNIGLPEASRRAHAETTASFRRFSRRLTAAAVACVGVYGALVAGMSERLLRAFYGVEFSRFSPLVVLAALQYVIAVSVFGQGIALKAAGRMRRLWRARAVVAAASLASMVVLVRTWDAVGAGWAGAATGMYFAIGVYAVYRMEFGQEAAGGPDDDPPLPAPLPPSVLLRPERGMP